MNRPLKQHLIDPEICIRCHTCEAACPVGAITHNETQVVVDAAKCNLCMSCISPCPTGSIDNWRFVDAPYSLEEQLTWDELPAQRAAPGITEGAPTESSDAAVAALLDQAHAGVGITKAPPSATKPTTSLFTTSKPAVATVQGNYRITSEEADYDVRHIILDLCTQVFPILEGQTVGITPPGLGQNGKPHAMRLYSVSSPRDGERPNTNNVSLTVKREPRGVCSNYVCDLKRGDTVNLCGPFGSTFLMPEDPKATLIMICTGTGSAPFRAFTMRRQRIAPTRGGMTLFFGARTPECLPYFGPLKKIPETLLRKHFTYSRVPNTPKEYVQDRMLAESATLAPLLGAKNSHIYVCGLKGMESGVENAFEEIARRGGFDWKATRDVLRSEGRYHIETY